jgi:hypothetical protein
MSKTRLWSLLKYIPAQVPPHPPPTPQVTADHDRAARRCFVGKTRAEWPLSGGSVMPMAGTKRGGSGGDGDGDADEN